MQIPFYMTKVNFLIHSLSYGGSEKVVTNLANYFKNIYDVNIINFGNQNETDYITTANRIFLDKKTPTNLISKIIIFIKRVLLLNQLKSTSDITISFVEYANLLNLINFNKKHKVFLSVRNHMSTKHSSKSIKSLFWKLTFRLLYLRADKIIACSKEIKKDLINSFKVPENKIIVIYNGFDFENIKELSKEAIVDQKEKEIFQSDVIISAGRLVEHKGFKNLIRYFSKLVDEFPNLKLVILGKGPLKFDLNNLIINLNLTNKAFILDFKKNPYMYFAKSKLFVLNSEYEGFPNIIVESMISGTPVISNDCKSGPSEIINYLIEKNLSLTDNANGILIPFDMKSKIFHQSIFNNAIISFLKNPSFQNAIKENIFDSISLFDYKIIYDLWNYELEH